MSAVAEIERENIIEQTMNGRREKARQGGWNGGFAPYGYYLKDNQLLIEETEAEAIRIIFDKFANSDIGLGGVAKYLNLQGIKKIPRQNGTLETWSSHFIRLILDNPVYCGKIAYGRRTREKVKGTKMNISRFMQRITFWKMDNMKELSARNCGKRFTQSVWQQELNSHPKSVRIGHTF